MSKKVTLVLGSGGARGYAHIGVIEELVARGYSINNIVGSSMGTVVGGIYSVGKLEEFKEWALKLDVTEALKMVDLSFAHNGAINGDKVFGYIDENFTYGKNIEDLDIPLTAVTTDLINQKEVWLQDGSLVDAMRASSAIPGVFVPVELNGKTYVDGAVLNPIPVLPVDTHKSDLTITVNLSGRSKARMKKSEFNIDNFDGKIKRAWCWLKRKVFNAPCDSLNAFKVMTRSMDIMQYALSEYKMANFKSDVIIDIPFNSCEFYEFHKAQEIIELGRELAKEALDEYEL